MSSATDEPDRNPALRHVRASRIATDGPSPRPIDETIAVPVEGRLTIDVERVESFTLLCTPGEPLALAAGFLLSEGIIESMEDVSVLKPCEDDPEVVRVRLKRPRPAIGDSGRNLLIVSSCGACGTEELETRIASLPKVGDSLRLDASLLRSIAGTLRGHQPLFQACGGTHAAALFRADGSVVASAEDAGRHNALDKAIGKLVLSSEPTAGTGAFLSGRVSLEMVGKCARAGIELVAPVSASTSLAVDVAERSGMTLCVFVRETRATVLTHPQRILGL